MITHIDINGKQFDIKNVSNDLLVFSFCVLEALVLSWENHLKKGDLCHEKVFYEKQIDRLKKERDQSKKIVNKILIQRNSHIRL